MSPLAKNAMRNISICTYVSFTAAIPLRSVYPALVSGVTGVIFICRESLRSGPSNAEHMLAIKQFAHLSKVRTWGNQQNGTSLKIDALIGGGGNKQTDVCFGNVTFVPPVHMNQLLKTKIRVSMRFSLIYWVHITFTNAKLFNRCKWAT